MLLPFGTSMNNLNAMAIEEYDKDPYMRYAMDIAKGYEDESGNNNYEPENYQSYEYDNYENIESTKKIKYNNINSNINGLETTTDLNNPLGVGSAALQGDEEGISTNAYGNGERNYNNGNFDFDCINNNDNDNTGGDGRTGPAGPQGERGLQGEQGEPGPNQILPTSINIREGNPDTSVSGTVSSFARCDEGDTVLSGSYVIFNPTIADSISDTAFITQTETGWVAQATESNPIEDLSIQATVNCFNNP
jgi:hypothetical protein